MVHLPTLCILPSTWPNFLIFVKLINKNCYLKKKNQNPKTVLEREREVNSKSQESK